MEMIWSRRISMGPLSATFYAMAAWFAVALWLWAILLR
jgi:hypothetical protein